MKRDPGAGDEASRRASADTGSNPIGYPIERRIRVSCASRRGFAAAPATHHAAGYQLPLNTGSEIRRGSVGSGAVKYDRFTPALYSL
jgi:hypothetical protein